MIILSMLNAYTLIFYTDPRANCPITKFLDECSDSLRTKILRQFMYVREFGLSPKIPNIKKVTGTDFWELRILGKDNIRIFCISKEKDIHIIHIFAKKKQKTPIKEIKIAMERIRSLDI